MLLKKYLLLLRVITCGLFIYTSFSQGQYMSYNSCPSRSEYYMQECVGNDAMLAVRCCRSSGMQCLANDTLNTFEGSQQWCRQHNAHICSIEELNSGWCCEQNNEPVWVNNTCQVKTVYCSQPRNNSGEGEISDIINIPYFTNDYRLSGINVLVYLESDGCGKKSIYFRKGDTMLTLADEYSDTRYENYAIQFEDSTVMNELTNAPSDEFIYTPVDSLSVIDNSFLSDQYQLIVTTTENYGRLYLHEWCVEVVYDQLLYMLTTYFIDNIENNTTNKQTCQPYSAVVYNDNGVILNSTQNISNIACHAPFVDGALEACVKYSNEHEQYYHICQFVILNEPNRTNNSCMEWNSMDTWINISQIMNGTTNRLPNQIIWTSPYYMQMPQFCPTSICNSKNSGYYHTCINVHANNGMNWYLDTVSMSMKGINWKVQTDTAFLTLWSSGNGFIQMEVVDCAWSMIGMGQEIFHFLVEEKETPVINITLEKISIVGSKINSLDQTLIRISQALEVVIDQLDIKNFTGSVLNGTSINILQIYNNMFGTLYGSGWTLDCSLFEAYNIQTLDIINSTFTTILNANHNCSLFSISMTHPLELKISNSTFDSIYSNIFDITIHGSPQYAIVGNVSFNNVHGHILQLINGNKSETIREFEMAISECTFTNLIDSSLRIEAPAQLSIIQTRFEHHNNFSIICIDCLQLKVYSVLFAHIQQDQSLIIFDSISSTMDILADNITTLAMDVEFVNVTLMRVECPYHYLIESVATSAFILKNISLIETKNPLFFIHAAYFLIDTIDFRNTIFDSLLYIYPTYFSIFHVYIGNTSIYNPKIGVNIQNIVLNHMQNNHTQVELFYFNYNNNGPLTLSNVTVDEWNGALLDLYVKNKVPSQIDISNLYVRHYYYLDANHSCVLCMSSNGVYDEPSPNITITNVHFFNISNSILLMISLPHTYPILRLQDLSVEYSTDTYIYVEAHYTHMESVVFAYNEQLNESESLLNIFVISDIYSVDSSQVGVTMYNVEFYENKHPFGVFWSQGQYHRGDWKLISCRFENNGGGVYIDNGDTVLLQNLTVDYIFPLMTLSSYNFFITGMNEVQVENCRFENNFAPFNSGGALHIANIYNSLRLWNTIFVNNSGNLGGAIVCSQIPYVEIRNCVFNRSYSPSDGGAMYFNYPPKSATDVFKVRALIVDSIFYLNEAISSGGAICFNFGVLEIQRCLFSGNSAKYGGALSLNDESTMKMSHSKLIMNTAGLNGAAVSDSSVDSRCKYIDNCDFEQNFALSQGGAIYAMSPHWAIINSSFYNNTAIEAGGALYTRHSSIDVNMSYFSHNSAFHNGGCFALEGTPDYGEYVVNINNCNFSENIAGSYGGTAIVTDFSVFVTDSTFDGNCFEDLCAQQGGIFSINTVDEHSMVRMILQDVTIRRGTSEIGGGLLLRHNVNSTLDVTLNRVIFENNNATKMPSTSDLALFQNFESGLRLVLNNVSDSWKGISWPTRVEFEVSTVDGKICPNCVMRGVVKAYDFFNQSYFPMEYCDISGSCSFIRLNLKCITNYTQYSCPTDEQYPSQNFSHGQGNISFVAKPGKLDEILTISLECDENLAGSICPLFTSLHDSENSAIIQFTECPKDLASKEYESNEEWFTCTEPQFPNYDLTQSIGDYPTLICSLVLLAVALFLILILGALHNADQLDCCGFCRKHKVEKTRPMRLLHYVIKILDLGTDVNLCQAFWRIYKYLHGGGIGDAEEVWFILAISSTTFIVSSWLVNISLSLILFRYISVYIPSNKHTQNTYRFRISVIILLVTLSGDFYVTLLLMNCRLFGLDFFNLGMTLLEMEQFTNWKLLSTVLLQNIPQLAFQAIALTHTEKNTAADIYGSIYMSMATSFIAIIGSIWIFWSQRNKLFSRLSFQLRIDLNTRKIESPKKKQQLEEHLRAHAGRFDSITEQLVKALEHLHRKRILLGSVNVYQDRIVIYGNILLPERKPLWKNSQEEMMSSYILISDQEVDHRQTVNLFTSHDPVKGTQTIDVNNLCKDILVHGFKLTQRFRRLMSANKLSFNAEFKVFEINYSIRSQPTGNVFLSPSLNVNSPSMSSIVSQDLEPNKIRYDELRSQYK